MALFLQFLPFLFKAANSVPDVLDYIHRMKETYQSKGEWTPEAEAAFTAELANLKSNPPEHWKSES